jgi:uncharacterized NAD(P)/FAD-binding protein YdhS
MKSTPKRILIVGGGASGVIAAIALMRAGIGPDMIDIADPRELLGEGLAYETRNSLHLLNVQSSKMSAIEELPNDYLEWSNALPYSFMERQSYGEYLRDRCGSGLNHIRDYVIDLDLRITGEISATFSMGTNKNYDEVVLAMGHGKARIPNFIRDLPESPRIILDVWDGSILPDCQTMLCFGTGLSFIDTALTHLSRKPSNRVIAISGSGNLPERIEGTHVDQFEPTLDEVNTLEKLRAYLSGAGNNWRAAVDGLRPIKDEMWLGFTPSEREEFLLTVGTAWSRRRHPMAPAIADRVEDEIKSGRIQIIKGKVSKVVELETAVEINLESGDSYYAEYLAICVGRDYKNSDPLSTSLIDAGKTRRGKLGIGLSVDASTGLLENSDGSKYSNIYALGPLRLGGTFETTAIPDIRRQAFVIASLAAISRI